MEMKKIITTISFIKYTHQTIVKLISMTKGDPIQFLDFDPMGNNIQLLCGIDQLAQALGYSLLAANRHYDGPFPYEVSFRDNEDTKYYQIMTVEEYKTFAVNSVVPIAEEESA
jgi:hypothetical protein